MPWTAQIRWPEVMESSRAGDDPEGVPEDLVAEAKAAFAQRGEGQFAPLVFDSLVDEGAPAMDHLLRFEHPQTRISVQVTAGHDASNLDGTVEPATAERLRLQLGVGDLFLVANVVGGAFSFHEVPHGVIRLLLDGPEGSAAVRTDWFRV
jgi:hypothetical protein